MVILPLEAPSFAHGYDEPRRQRAPPFGAGAEDAVGEQSRHAVHANVRSRIGPPGMGAGAILYLVGAGNAARRVHHDDPRQATPTGGQYRPRKGESGQEQGQHPDREQEGIGEPHIARHRAHRDRRSEARRGKWRRQWPAPAQQVQHYDDRRCGQRGREISGHGEGHHGAPGPALDVTMARTRRAASNSACT